MSILQTLQERSNTSCELCGLKTGLKQYNIPPALNETVDTSILACETCFNQIEGNEDMDANHWRCLNDSMWSQVPAVQILAYQQLSILTQAGETWAQDLLDMMYLEDEHKAWAESGLAHMTAGGDSEAIDSNGTKLAAGDNVYLIKDLPVKGAGFTAKQGTTVRGISLTSNPEHIEGRVNGQKIVILTKFVKKV